MYIPPAFLLVAAITFNSSAQQILFKNYTEQNGLPSSEVYQVFEDHTGHIWFATDNGAVRFDGEVFELFNQSNGLTDPVVFSCFKDLGNNIWFRTFSSAASVYREGKMVPFAFNSQLKTLGKKATSNSLVVDSLGTLYISIAQSGFYKLSNSGIIEELNVTPEAYHLIQVGKQDFLFGANIKTDQPGIPLIFKGEKYHADSRMKIDLRHFIFWKNNLYVANRHKVFKCTKGKMSAVFETTGSIINLSTDRENNLWIGFLNNGVLRFTGDSFCGGMNVPLLQNRSVSSVLQDTEGGFWFSTLDKGVYYIPNLNIRNFPLPRDSKINEVISGEEDIFMGFDDGTLLCLDGKLKTEKWAVNAGSPIISGLWDNINKLIWISTTMQTLVLDAQGKILRQHQYVRGARSFISAKKMVRREDKIFGVNAYGVHKLDLSGKILSKKELDFWCRNILVGDKLVYLAGITGLYTTDTTFNELIKLDEFEQDKVSNLVELPGEKVLVTTIGNGFKVISENNVASFGDSGDSYFKNIYSVVVDSALWLATEKGLLKADLHALTEEGRFNYKFIGRSTGLAGDKVNFVITHGNEILGFFNDGFSVMEKGKIHFANSHPASILKEVTINNHLIEQKEIGVLSYLQNNVSFAFGFLAFNNRDIFIRHKSSASSPQWNYVNDHSVNYYSLAPGKYNFTVEYSTDRINWERVDLPGEVIISPPWWETIYFRVIVLLTVAIFFFVYFRAKYKRRLLELELDNRLRSEKERIARDLHDNIGSKLVSLSLAFNQVVKQYDIEATVAEGIFNDVNITVNELKDTIWAIQKEGVSINEFCDKLTNLIWRLRQNDDGIHYDLYLEIKNGSHVLTPTQAINLYRIVQEAVANSQKHSMGKSIALRVLENILSKQLTVRIEDDGKGFLAGNGFSDNHRGLKNIGSRAEEINAMVHLSSQPERGTYLEIKLPI
jgi:signal transduction histidine kinase/ligand-binding sensor domain-containing protein